MASLRLKQLVCNDTAQNFSMDHVLLKWKIDEEKQYTRVMAPTLMDDDEGPLSKLIIDKETTFENVVEVRLYEFDVKTDPDDFLEPNDSENGSIQIMASDKGQHVRAFKGGFPLYSSYDYELHYEVS